MSEIIPTTKERIKKFSVLGCDVSIGFAKYVKRVSLPDTEINRILLVDVNYLIDHTEENGIITHRFILWRFKLEVKSMVEYDFKFA